MRAYTFIKTKGAGRETIDEIRDLKEITEVNRIIAGPWEIVAEVEVNSEAELGDLLSKFRRYYDVKDTLTLIAED